MTQSQTDIAAQVGELDAEMEVIRQKALRCAGYHERSPTPASEAFAASQGVHFTMGLVFDLCRIVEGYQHAIKRAADALQPEGKGR